MHFLPLLEQKVGALDQAAPLQGWDLPDEFATLRRLLGDRPVWAFWRDAVALCYAQC